MMLALVFAQVTVPDPALDPGDFFARLAAAVLDGKWQAVAALAAIGVVFLLRQLATRIPGKIGIFFGTARGGAVVALLGGIVTALAQILLAGQRLNVSLFVNGIVLGITAAGGWTLIRRLIWGDSAPVAYPVPTKDLTLGN